MRVKKEDEINNFAQIKFVFASKLMTWTSWLLVEGYYRPAVHQNLELCSIKL